MKNNVVVLHIRADGSSEIKVAGREVSVVMLDERGGDGIMRAGYVGEQISHQEKVELMGDARWSAAE